MPCRVRNPEDVIKAFHNNMIVIISVINYDSERLEREMPPKTCAESVVIIYSVKLLYTEAY